MSNAVSAPYRGAAARRQGSALARVLYENGLSIVLMLAFLGLLWAQSWSGWKTYNQEQAERSQPAVGYLAYFTTGHFVEATAENWESEFLQMAAFVWLTVFLRQKGSPESKNVVGEDEPQDREPDPSRPGAPWPVRRGGFVLWLYSNSLTLAFLLMFLIAFFIHAAGGAREYSEEQAAHGQPQVTMMQFMGTSEFWFQSMQNWQSEFLAIAMMVILSVFLRQKGSAESKPVDARHSEQE
ncbi:MAG TPA: DUF6766 family protein [Tepidisphaeraceae bacterium]|nr:DUF6766 family protein [Tepidisphaeraceae bacterium]